MKPSGIEWLGDIPEHWEVRKLKYVAEIFPSNIDKHSKEGEKAIRLCNYTDVYKNDYITNDMDLMVATASNEQIEKFTLLINDVIITKDSETANDIAIPAFVKENLENVVCGYHLSVMRPNEKIHGEFLFRVLQSKTINIQFEVNANGVTRVGLGTYSQKSPKVPIPPIEEQQQIVSYIETETSKLDQTISTIEKEIALVEEYKTSLIAEAVTGKIDVRDFVIPEVEETESFDEIEDELSIAADGETEFETEETE
jgi:type I restriction enzyme S subunit